jgi:hypothetical protein
MPELSIPILLSEEFATVEAVWNSAGSTRRVDSFILAWVKLEKQLRRLFCFIVFQHPDLSANDIESVVGVLAANNRLYPETFIAGIEALSIHKLQDLLSPRYDEFSAEITRMKSYRNKLIHGQIRGQKVTSRQLEKDVIWIANWMSTLATSAADRLGYDGLQRNTYRAAKVASTLATNKYPFKDPAECGNGLSKLVRRTR